MSSYTTAVLRLGVIYCHVSSPSGARRRKRVVFAVGVIIVSGERRNLRNRHPTPHVHTLLLPTLEVGSWGTPVVRTYTAKLNFAS